MRRADRLFQLVQHLHPERVITARALAEVLEVSERTIYRDIQDLSLSGVPIEGEAGVGYRLGQGYRLPPLMFDEEELAALLVGMRMVQGWTDRGLARAAARALDKIEAGLPERLRERLNNEEILVPDFHVAESVREYIAQVRRGIRETRKLRLDYVREDATPSSRTVWPLGLTYWGRVWTLIAWCELRGDFRQFRLDRMQSVEPLLERYPVTPGRGLSDYLLRIDAQCKHAQEETHD